MVAVGKRAVDLDVDAKQFYEVLTLARVFDKKLYTGLRRDLRKAGEGAAKSVRAEVVKEPGSAPVEFSRGLRANLASGIRVQIKASESSRQVGVFIASTGKSAASKQLKRSYDKPKGWRHPVWQRGADPVWTTQKGRPYFGSVIAKQEPAIAKAVKVVLDRAVDSIANG
ncbi:MAG: hypothetical protein QG597_2071 [Actinomycetota bacterium]|nr:hypothetical protein [Actinomycetota bacterium]